MSDWHNRIALVVFSTLLPCAGLAGASAASWPLIRPQAMTVHVADPAAPDAGLRMIVREVAGAPLYELKCHGPGYVRTPDETADDWVYLNPLDCFMRPLKNAPRYQNLLAEVDDPSEFRHTRGSFTENAIDGRCSDVPGWGLERNFDVRGMRVSLRMSQVKFQDNPAPRQLASYAFTATVAPRPEAGGSFSQPVPCHPRACAFTGACRSTAGSPADWPDVRPLTVQVHIDDPQNPSIGFDILVESTAGTPAYSLRCHGAAYPDGEFSGLMQCHLVSLVSTDAVSTLFSETFNQSSDWSNRGRFLPENVVGQCSELIDWGLVRRFDLRKMRVTLAISNVARTGDARIDEGITAFDFTARVEPRKQSRTLLTAHVACPSPDCFYTDACDPDVAKRPLRGF